jgi:YidC/Oxa1 family membrane protein insertase
VIPAGGVVEVINRLFAGAKEVHLLDKYTETQDIPRFDLAVDFGWFYFLTKPIFYVLDYLNRVLGNFGLAILLFTVIIRILFYPLANKSFRAMHAMRKLQPEMTKMREQYSEDRQRLHKEMMELYKREKVNPMAGCLPIAMQIPVFFALYKVLFVTIEMRHTPFYGWIQDLSAPDPTSLFNLFGLIPWDPPMFLHIGIWPLMMGVSMFLQQKINPQPVDPMQAKIFLALPVVFTFVLANFPAGLVIYWTWNNMLSMAQQWTIYKRAGITKQPAQPAKRT